MSKATEQGNVICIRIESVYTYGNPKAVLGNSFKFCKNFSIFYRLTQSRVSLPLESDGCEFGHVGYLEHVQLNVTLSARYRGDISLTLISPAGTRSTLLPFRIRDRRRGSFDEWTFMSTHFWGETSEGTWILEIQKGSPLSSKGEFLSLRNSFIVSFWFLPWFLFTKKKRRKKRNKNPQKSKEHFCNCISKLLIFVIRCQIY